MNHILAAISAAAGGNDGVAFGELTKAGVDPYEAGF
jgi:hypothetical protein